MFMLDGTEFFHVYVLNFFIGVLCSIFIISFSKHDLVCLHRDVYYKAMEVFVHSVFDFLQISG